MFTDCSEINMLIPKDPFAHKTYYKSSISLRLSIEFYDKGSARTLSLSPRCSNVDIMHKGVEMSMSCWSITPERAPELL